MKIIVLGGGMVGSAMAMDLSKDFEVSCADLNPRSIPNVQSLQLDVTHTEDLKKIIAPFDLVIGAVPGFLGFHTLKTIIESGKNVVDISFFPEDAFLLDELAKKNNVTAVVDCGVAPGMCNMIAGFLDTKLKMDSYTCLVGGLPVVRIKPYEYKAPFSPIDVLEEYTRPARFKQKGELVTKEALTDIEEISFKEAGTLEAFNTDGLRSLMITLPHVPNMIEKTLRYPGHAALMKTYRESGFFSKEKMKVGNAEVAPIELISQLLFSNWKYEEGEEDFTVMQVIIEGEDKTGRVKHVYSLYDRYNQKDQQRSMARTTGYTATAVARLVIENKFNRKGIIPPEYIGAEEEAFRYVLGYLKEREVEYQKD